MKFIAVNFRAFLIFNLLIQTFCFNLNLHESSTFIARNLCECRSECIKDLNCVLSYWKPLHDAFLCMNQLDRTIPLVVTPGVNFYCQDCLMTRSELDQGVESGVIQFKNVALNKNTEASSVYSDTMLNENAVDGDPTKRFASGSSESSVDSKEWLMIDLGKEYRIYQIKISGMFVEKHGFLKVYLSPTFNVANDFSTYPEILDVPGDAASTSDVYKITGFNSGRYAVVQRQDLRGYMDIGEIELYTANVRVI